MKNLFYYLNRIPSRFFIDISVGKDDSTVFVSGMGRSGTTWIARLINYNNSYRDIFEPFHPYKVEEARMFHYYQYLTPKDQDPSLLIQANNILSGKFRSRWTDRENRKLVTTKRIIKDIRTNLLLKWLKTLRPNMPILLIIRHPLSVVTSWLKLQWGKASDQESDFETIILQKHLLNDFPIINEALQNIDANDNFETILFQWCILHFVPFSQFTQDDILFVFYENLILEPVKEIERIFLYLGKDYDEKIVLSNLSKPSSTNWLERKFDTDNRETILNFKNDILNERQLSRASQILSLFGLNDLYDKNGIPCYDYVSKIDSLSHDNFKTCFGLTNTHT